MKKIIFLTYLFISCSMFSQEVGDSIYINKEYNELMNYIPKQLKVTKKTRPNNRLIQIQDLNTIVSLHLLYNYKDKFGLTEEDSKWLIHRIDQLAVALYLDDKKILLKKVGGYNGCPKKMIEKKKVKHHNLTILKLCHGCTSTSFDSEFISFFNSRMLKLMNTE